MRGIPKIYYCLLICVLVFICVVIISPHLDDTTDSKKVPDMFGLSSTECTISLDDGGGTSLPVWSLPSGYTYSDIVWASDDASIVTVSGGTVTGLSEGTATITATVGGFSDTCKVTVTNEEIKTQSRSYDAYSENFDYLLLSDNSSGGFTKGLLSATFNAGDNIVFSLVGYDIQWLQDNKTFIGNASADFSKIKMSLIDSNKKVIATSTYINEYRALDGSGYLSIGTSDTALFPVSKNKLSYGETYTVSFDLYTGNGLIKYTTVSDSFEYCKGDGYRDVSGTFTRTYSWRFGGNSTDFYDSKYIHSFTVTYNYVDYWNGYYKNTKLLTIGTSDVRNYMTYQWVYEFSQDNETVTLLSEAVKDTYGGTNLNGQDFAQYLLAFGQICFDYEYDNVQYYLADKKYVDSVDYWAYVGQTIYSGYGDCEDTSMLLAAIFKKLGYDSALLVLPNHMAMTVSLDEYENAVGEDYLAIQKNGKTYYFCETTAKSPVLFSNGYSKAWISYYEELSGKSVYYLLGMSSTKYADSDINGFYVL